MAVDCSGKAVFKRILWVDLLWLPGIFMGGISHFLVADDVEPPAGQWALVQLVAVEWAVS